METEKIGVITRNGCPSWHFCHWDGVTHPQSLVSCPRVVELPPPLES